MNQITGIEWRTDEIDYDELKDGQNCIFAFDKDREVCIFRLEKHDEGACWLNPYTLDCVDDDLFKDPSVFKWALIDYPAEVKTDSMPFQITTHGFSPDAVYQFKDGRIYNYHSLDYYSKEVQRKITAWIRKEIDEREFNDLPDKKRLIICGNLRLSFTVPVDSKLHRLLS